MFRAIPVLLGGLAIGFVAPAFGQKAINLPDQNLERIVRATLAKPTGELTEADMLSLTGLNAEAQSITNLSGIESAINLLDLNLADNSIRNVTPLSGLTNLQTLDLSYNPITNCSTLSGLTNMRAFPADGISVTNVGWMVGWNKLYWLSLRNNQIDDITPLGGLTDLGEVYLSNNPITNYSPLWGLTNASFLQLANNRMRDLAFAQKLTNVVELDLSGNRLTNILAIANLPSLRTVYLHRNALDLRMGSASMNVIQEMQSRGVTVIYQPQWQPPSIQGRTNWLVAANVTSTVEIQALDDTANFNEFKLTAHSSNTNLLDDSSIDLKPVTNGWPSQYGWELTVSPTINQTGTTTITLTATDDTLLSTTNSLTLQVLQSQPFDGQILNSPGFSWTTVGSPGWFGQAAISHDGILAAQNGSPQSFLQTTVTGPGTLSFWWKSSDPTNIPPQLVFVTQFKARCASCGLSGGITFPAVDGWYKTIVGVPAGSWVLSWEAYSDAFWTPGGPPFWLDEVRFVPGEPPSYIILPVKWDLSAVLVAFAELGSTYDIEASSDLKTWSQMRRLYFYNFAVRSDDTIPDPARRFYRLRRVIP